MKITDTTRLDELGFEKDEFGQLKAEGCRVTFNSSCGDWRSISSNQIEVRPDFMSPSAQYKRPQRRRWRPEKQELSA